jgi:hypothetical protein
MCSFSIRFWNEFLQQPVLECVPSGAGFGMCSFSSLFWKDFFQQWVLEWFLSAAVLE